MFCFLFQDFSGLWGYEDTCLGAMLAWNNLKLLLSEFWKRGASLTLQCLTGFPSDENKLEYIENKLCKAVKLANSYAKWLLCKFDQLAQFKVIAVFRFAHNLGCLSTELHVTVHAGYTKVWLPACSKESTWVSVLGLCFQVNVNDWRWKGSGQELPLPWTTTTTTTVILIKRDFKQHKQVWIYWEACRWCSLEVDRFTLITDTDVELETLFYLGVEYTPCEGEKTATFYQLPKTEGASRGSFYWAINPALQKKFYELGSSSAVCSQLQLFFVCPLKTTKYPLMV